MIRIQIFTTECIYIVINNYSGELKYEYDRNGTILKETHSLILIQDL